MNYVVKSRVSGLYLARDEDGNPGWQATVEGAFRFDTMDQAVAYCGRYGIQNYDAMPVKPHGET